MSGSDRLSRLIGGLRCWLIARLRLLIGRRLWRRLHGGCGASSSGAMLLQEAENVVFGDTAAKARAGELAQVNVVVLGDFADQR